MMQFKHIVSILSLVAVGSTVMAKPLSTPSKCPSVDVTGHISQEVATMATRKLATEPATDDSSGIRVQFVGDTITVGLSNGAEEDEARMLFIPSKLSDVVKQFNAKAGLDAVGKDQPVLSQEEIIAALQYVVLTHKWSKTDTKVEETIQKIISDKALSGGSYIQSNNGFRYTGPYRLSEIDGSDVKTFTVWSVQLMVPDSNGVHAFTIRQRFLRYRTLLLEAERGPINPPSTSVRVRTGYIDPLNPYPPTAQAESIIVGVPAQGDKADNRIAPIPSELADVVREFNEKAQSDPVGKTQPPLTVDELRTAIQWIIMTRNSSTAGSTEYATLKTIIENGRLVNGASLQSANKYTFKITVFSIAGGSEHRIFSVWSVRLVIPGGGVETFTIREQFANYRVYRVF